MKKMIVIVLLFISVQNVYARILYNHYDLESQTDTAINIPYHHKSPLESFALSFGNTVIPAALGALILKNLPPNASRGQQELGTGLLVYGIVIGPSVGLFYDHYYLRGLGGIGFRAIAGIAGTYAAYVIIANSVYEALSYGTIHQSMVLPSVVFLVSAFYLAGSILTQFIEAPAFAARYNKKHRLSIAPTYFYREKSPGLAMSVRF